MTSAVLIFTPDLERRLASVRSQLDGVDQTVSVAARSILATVEDIVAQMRAGATSQARLIDQLEAIAAQCAFHDLSSQRIGLARDALGSIERRMLRVDTAEQAFQEALETAEDKRRAELMLHGPDTPGKGLAQDEIDSLFS